jgi:hypothetical protein
MDKKWSNRRRGKFFILIGSICVVLGLVPMLFGDFAHLFSYPGGSRYNLNGMTMVLLGVAFEIGGYLWLKNADK